MTHRDPDGSWAELLASGLTFDCRGLAPGPGTDLPPAGPAVGLPILPTGEVLDLAPGPHLAEAAGLVPVLRGLAGLGARLAGLPGVQAVIWTPGGSWVEPVVFRRAVADWLGGGAFPALALTAIERVDDGAMISRGLALIAGQELRLEPDRPIPAAALARIAVRLIHDLVLHGPIAQEEQLTGPDGETLRLVPVRNRVELRVLVRPTSAGR